ncbi:uncharacterized protein [Atheta coriaria]|uniref:uncharacterized protein n=1 Tax=Dalotia coriaria TaxID=877792 RepID=UPI0031F360E9
MWITLVFTQLLQLVVGNYCEFGLCEDEQQYCCGKNKCCSKSSNLWFFWAGILVVVFILVIVAICNRKPQKDPHGPYEKLRTADFIEEAT